MAWKDHIFASAISATLFVTEKLNMKPVHYKCWHWRWKETQARKIFHWFNFHWFKKGLEFSNAEKEPKFECEGKKVQILTQQMKKKWGMLNKKRHCLGQTLKTRERQSHYTQIAFCLSKVAVGMQIVRFKLEVKGGEGWGGSGWDTQGLGAGIAQSKMAGEGTLFYCPIGGVLAMPAYPIFLDPSPPRGGAGWSTQAEPFLSHFL